MAEIKQRGHITHIVFMGMGEPLLNLKSVLPALDWLQEGWGFNLSKRYITVSTSGYLAGIEQLIKQDINLTLRSLLVLPSQVSEKPLCRLKNGTQSWK